MPGGVGGRYSGDMSDPLLFVLAVLALLGTPGPTNTLLATAGASDGLGRALMLVPAEAAGYLIAITTLGLALGPMVTAVPALGLALRVAVGLYLIWMALKLWRGGAANAGERVITPARVFLTTLLNPKAMVFALGVVPFGHQRVGLYLAGFTVLAMLVALGWVGLGAVLGRAAAAGGCSRLVPRLGAAAVTAFAALMLGSPLLR
ncbi:LysE family translocator [Ancylobacter sp. G4_0304]|uniref:LysE family translocator n=1 Tax=Ancylobacter sp. G4_0304 TaxID=3114289 RepID=UPI0039C6EEE9